MAPCSTWRLPKYVLAALALVSAGVAAYGAYKQGEEQSEALANEASAALLRADDEFYIKQKQIEAKQEEAIIQAGRIRERARQIRSTQRAGFGASGAVVDTGSAQHIIDQTNFLAERDALAVAYSAANFVDSRQHEQGLITSAGINTANARAKQAKAALIGGYTSAAGSAIGGATAAYGAL